MKPIDKDTATLIKARDIIANGWCKRDFQRNGKYCVIGALSKAANSFPDAIRLGQQYFHRYPATWNDRFWRTHKQVLRKFDAAIERRIKENSK